MKKLTVSNALPLMDHLAKQTGTNMQSHNGAKKFLFKMNNQKLRELIARTKATLLAAEPAAKALFGIEPGTAQSELAIRRFALNSIKNN